MLPVGKLEVAPLGSAFRISQRAHFTAGAWILDLLTTLEIGQDNFLLGEAWSVSPFNGSLLVCHPEPRLAELVPVEGMVG